MPPILLGTLILAALIWMSLALGGVLLHFLRIEATPGERAVLAAGLGLGALQIIPFTLFTLGIGNPPTFWVLLSAIAIGLAPQGCRELKAIIGWLPSVRPTEWWQRIVLAAFAVLLGLIYLRAMTPAASHDDLSYHLAASVRYLDAGGFRYLPTLTYTNWPISVELLFASILAIHRDAPVAVATFLFGIITLGGMFAIARRAGGIRAGAAACTLLLVYKVFWEEMTIAHVDLGTAAFSTVAVLSLMQAQDPGKSARTWILPSSVIAGLAATTKLSGIWVVVAISVLAAWITRQQGLKASLLVFARCALIGFTIAAPWFVRTWIITGNPVYPALFGLFGGIEWTEEGWPRIQHYFKLFNSPPGLPPTPQNLAISKVVIVAAGLFILAVTFLTTRNSKVAMPARFAALFTALFVMGSAFQLRLIMAALPSIFACLGVWLTRVSIGSGPAIAMLSTVLVAFSATSSYLDNKHLTMRIAIGLERREAHYARNVPDFPVVEYVNKNLHPESRILVSTWEEQTALYRPFAYRANYWLQDTFHYDSEERLLHDLRRMAITHLVYKLMDDEWCAQSKICSGRRDTESAVLGRLARRRGTPLGTWNGVTLYLLDLSDSARPAPETPGYP